MVGAIGNTRNNSGLQTYSKKFQGIYQKHLREGSTNAFELAREETIEYFKSLGFEVLND